MIGTWKGARYVDVGKEDYQAKGTVLTKVGKHEKG